MEYAAALERLYQLSPRGMRLGLDRVRAAARLLGNPEERLRAVQIAGTNGKGSTSLLLAHAAAAAGLKVGLYTSPHLHRFSERIRIDGVEASRSSLGRHLGAALDIAAARPDLTLTFFEVATLAALALFAEEEVDLAVLEVGLGGRLDATSIAHPVLTAVTSVGLDHTAVLGGTIAAIAREKAGIARPGVPLLAGPLSEEALAAVAEAARTAGAPLRILGRDFFPPADLEPPWPGRHQRDNLAIALALYEALAASDPRLTRPAFAAALPWARWPGRFERIPGRPEVILDGAHNREAALALVETLAAEGVSPAVLVFGALNDKPIEAMLALLRPIVGTVVHLAPPLHRAADPRAFAALGERIAATVDDALTWAKELAGANGVVLVTGSLFNVAAVRRVLLDEPTDPPVGL